MSAPVYIRANPSKHQLSNKDTGSIVQKISNKVIKAANAVSSERSVGIKRKAEEELVMDRVKPPSNSLAVNMSSERSLGSVSASKSPGELFVFWSIPTSAVVATNLAQLRSLHQPP